MVNSNFQPIQDEDDKSCQFNLKINQNLSQNQMNDDRIAVKKKRTNDEFNHLINKWKIIIEGDPPIRQIFKMIVFDLIPCCSKILLQEVRKTVIAREYLSIEFNIINILRRVLELDKIKHIMFNDKQLEIFNLSNTRIIDMNRHNQVMNDALSDKKVLSKKSIERISNIYQEFSNSSNNIDQKLVEYLYFIQD